MEGYKAKNDDRTREDSVYRALRFVFCKETSESVLTYTTVGLFVYMVLSRKHSGRSLRGIIKQFGNYKGSCCVLVETGPEHSLESVTSEILQVVELDLHQFFDAGVYGSSEEFQVGNALQKILRDSKFADIFRLEPDKSFFNRALIGLGMSPVQLSTEHRLQALERSMTGKMEVIKMVGDAVQSYSRNFYPDPPIIRRFSVPGGWYVCFEGFLIPKKDVNGGVLLAGGTILTLLEGWRPLSRLTFVAWCQWERPIRIDVLPNGVVQFTDASVLTHEKMFIQNTKIDNQAFSLSTIQFFAPSLNE